MNCVCGNPMPEKPWVLVRMIGGLREPEEYCGKDCLGIIERHRRWSAKQPDFCGCEHCWTETD